MLPINHLNKTPPGGIAPEMGRIADARAHFGVSRSWIYRAAPAHPGLLLKLGRRTLVNFVVLRGILTSLPPAEIRGATKEGE